MKTSFRPSKFFCFSLQMRDPLLTQVFLLLVAKCLFVFRHMFDKYRSFEMIVFWNLRLTAQEKGIGNNMLHGNGGDGERRPKISVFYIQYRKIHPINVLIPSYRRDLRKKHSIYIWFFFIASSFSRFGGLIAF